MKKLSFALLTILIASSAYAKENRLTKEEFLSGVESGRIELQRAKALNLPEPLLLKVQDEQVKKFPGFKPEMWYVGYIRDNKFIYNLFFDWTVPSCLLRIEEIDEKLGKPNGSTMDTVGQKVDKKYCEKFLGIKL